MNPTCGPRRAASACSHAAVAAARSGGRPDARRAPIIPASTSPEPAVARRSSPWSTTRTAPVSSAITVAGPFSSTVQPSWIANARAASRRSATGRRSGELLELAVVRREDSRRRAPRQVEAVTGGERVQRVTVGDDRHGGPGDQAADRRHGGGIATETGSHDQRPVAAEPVEHLVGPFRVGQGRLQHLERCRCGATGRRHRDEAGSAACHATRREPGGPEHPGTAGDDAHRGRPLVGVGRSPWEPRRHVAGVDAMARRRARRRARCRPPRCRRPATGRHRTAGPASGPGT